MQRIHRRKNQDIPKDFVCAEGCGKAYGSYAALYTHMKNKHGCLRTIDIKGNSLKLKATGRKGRPLTKTKEQVDQIIINQKNCKLCYEEQCLCDSSFDSSDIDKNINILSDRTYLKLINSIGHLNVGETFTWIRSTEQDYYVITKEKLKQMAQQFNMKNNFTSEVYLSDRWLQYLSHISKFLDKRYVNELFEGIFLILCKPNITQIGLLISGNQDFVNVKRCSQEKKKQWKQFVQTILVI